MSAKITPSFVSQKRLVIVYGVTSELKKPLEKMQTENAELKQNLDIKNQASLGENKKESTATITTSRQPQSAYSKFLTARYLQREK